MRTGVNPAGTPDGGLAPASGYFVPIVVAMVWE